VIEFTRILCAIDFSDTATRALVYAAALATWYESKLTVLHVVPAFEASMVSPLPRLDGEHRTPYAPVRADVLTDMRSAVERIGASALEPALLAEEGRPHRGIVDCATARQSHLLVLGTHGREGFNRLFLGSVAEKVVRTAPCPVLTVPPTATPTTLADVAFKRVLCPIDFSPSSLRALAYALDLARQANGSVSVLHALEYMDPEEPGEHVGVDIRRNRQHVIDHARERLHAQLGRESRTWCEIEEVVVISRAYKAVLQRAAETDVDLIVMGAQGSSGIELMLYGSNTQHVVRAATCPVLTVRA
jgi:nucleotide-binding universal stress UspA family protein